MFSITAQAPMASEYSPLFNDSFASASFVSTPFLYALFLSFSTSSGTLILDSFAYFSTRFNGPNASEYSPSVIAFLAFSSITFIPFVYASLLIFSTSAETVTPASFAYLSATIRATRASCGSSCSIASCDSLILPDIPTLYARDISVSSSFGICISAFFEYAMATRTDVRASGSFSSINSSASEILPFVAVLYASFFSDSISSGTGIPAFFA